MAHVKDDADASVSKDSVFDWGGGSSKEGRSNSECSGGGPSSRYDPKAMSRIVDITDLVDDDDVDSDDEDNVVPAVSSSAGKQQKFGGKRGPGYGPGGAGTVALFRQAVILVAIVGVIVAASLAIGYAVIGSDPDASPTGVGGAPFGNARKEERREQERLEIAERIVTACAESRLDSDMKECQKICKKNMCCFEAGDYSCAQDERRDCAVYAGCQALVEGVPEGAMDEKDG